MKQLVITQETTTFGIYNTFNLSSLYCSFKDLIISNKWDHTMRILVIGGTGFLGSHLLPRLHKQGHDITVLTRSRDKADDLESPGIKGVVGDLLQPESFLSRISPQDAVISVAMPEIRPGRISVKQLRLLRKQTTIFFSTAIALAQQFNCPLILTLGTSFRTTGKQIADESWPLERFGIAKIGEFVDPLLSVMAEQGSPPLIQMIPGALYGPGGLFRDLMYEWMKAGKYRVVGGGKNYIPRIHVEDCAEAYVKAVGKMPLGEKFIIADDDPCTTKEFADAMADCMDIPRPKSVPGFLIRIAMGKLMYETITMNCQVSNAKAKKYLNWKLKYPTYREGLPAAIEAIEKGNITLM